MTPPDDATPLALLDPDEERALAVALRAAWSPGEIDAKVNAALIEAALTDPLAPATDQEIVESERLARSLEGDGDHPDAILARALAAAAAPRAIAPARAERIARAAVSPARSNVIFVTFGAIATAVAAAAAVMVFVLPLRESATPNATLVPAAALVQSRSTAPMFDRAAFEQASATARIDRIAVARSRDLRDNQYALWGVR